MAQILVVEDADELRHEQAGFACSDTHGELVAKETRCRFAETGQSHMLAQRCGRFHVELVQRDDAIDFARAGEIGDDIDHLPRGHIFRHGVNVGENVEWPIGIAMLVEGKQLDAAAETCALA